MPRLTSPPAVHYRQNKPLQQALHAVETACLHETQKLPRREKQAEMAKDNVDHFFPKLSANDELDCWEASNLAISPSWDKITVCKEYSLGFLLQLLPLATLLLIGFACGYGIREWIARRRRIAAREKFYQEHAELRRLKGL
jgi:hypothetical protein